MVADHRPRVLVIAVRSSCEAKTDAEKQAALDKIQDIWLAQVPSVITGATPERIVWRKTVHGIVPNVASTILWHNVWVE